MVSAARYQLKTETQEFTQSPFPVVHPSGIHGHKGIQHSTEGFGDRLLENKEVAHVPPSIKVSDCSQLQCSIIHISQGLESPETPSTGDERNVARTYTEAILHHTAESPVICGSMDGAGVHYVKQMSQAKKQRMFSLKQELRDLMEAKSRW